MAEVQLVDGSMRDGNQSLWGATGLRTDHILQIAPVLDRVGFRALDFMSSTAMGWRYGRTGRTRGKGSGSPAPRCRTRRCS